METAQSKESFIAEWNIAIQRLKWLSFDQNSYNKINDIGRELENIVEQKADNDYK